MTERLSGLVRWQRFGLAFVLGGLATLALPPYYLVFLLIPSLAVLLMLAMAAGNSRQAFWAGWWWGFGYFVFGLYWFANSLLVEPEKHAFLIPFAVTLIPAALAVYIGLVTALTRRFARGIADAIPLFTAFWLLAEWARAYLFTGFPWNLIGYGWTFSDAMIQPAAYIGIYGLSAITVFAAASWAFPAFPGRMRWLYPAAGMGLISALWLSGGMRLQDAGEKYVEGVKLRIVQANIQQHHKWQPEMRRKAVATYLQASSENVEAHEITHIIWPESAVAYLLNEEPTLQKAIGMAAPPGGALFTGALRSERQEEGWQVWNSIFVVNADGQIADYYDKGHLVPFGEYVPFREFLPIDKITEGTKDYASGPGPLLLQVDSLASPVLPQVCYEGVFPHWYTEEKRRPAFILNVTNDAWFGETSGPYQHMQMTRLRAVERGVPLVRAANTGISVITDAYGRIVAQTALNTYAVMDKKLPSALRERTVYTILGEGTTLGGITILLLLLTLYFRRFFKK